MKLNKVMQITCQIIQVILDVQMQNFDKLFVVDLNNDGNYVFLYCSENCYKK
jgi:hypothetical protein